MTFDDFLPFPLRDALIKAFHNTQNVILKLPTNIALEQTLLDIADCYVSAGRQEAELKI